jgi:hypothetical protein
MGRARREHCRSDRHRRPGDRLGGPDVDERVVSVAGFVSGNALALRHAATAAVMTIPFTSAMRSQRMEPRQPTVPPAPVEQQPQDVQRALRAGAWSSLLDVTKASAGHEDDGGSTRWMMQHVRGRRSGD